MAYVDPVLNLILSKLKEGTSFRTYQVGMPSKAVANSDLPLLYIWSPNTVSAEYTMGGLKKFRKSVVVGVVTLWTSSAPSQIQSYTNQLDELLEKRDADYTLTGGVLKVIQDNKSLDTNVDIAVDPSPEITVEKEFVDNEGILGVEGRVEFVVEVLQQ